MYIFNIIKLPAIAITLLILHLVTLNTSNVCLCEHPETFTEDTLFYKIEQKGSNIWDVIFKNVDRTYKVTSHDIANNFTNQNFEFATSDNKPFKVGLTKTGNNIKDVVIDHFNDIQRGKFHSFESNNINPNSNGKIAFNKNIYNDYSKHDRVQSPLDQFEIRNLISIDAPILGNIQISYTNFSLYLTLSALFAVTLNILATNYEKIIANSWSISQESIYATVHSIVVNQINDKAGQSYYPFIYCLFIIILSSNLIGMIPYSFASTSHFILTFFLSFSIVLGSTLLGFSIHKLRFFSLFVPAGCPLGLLPLLVLIEFISFLARNVSLGLRLAANILSGHMLLNILSEFTYKIMETNIIYFIIGLIPLMFIIAFSALELGIAFIQAQVFVVLSSSYIKDSLSLH